MQPLTQIQATVLEAIKALIHNGAPPTAPAIARQLTTPDHAWSHCAVHVHLKALVRKGAIVVTPMIPPSIKVVVS
jgi:SOS-response transcriptional repressor LexA